MFSTWYGLWGFKDLKRRKLSDKVLRDKAFHIVKNPKCDRYQRDIPSMVYTFFDKKTALLPDKSVSGSGLLIIGLNKIYN